MSYLGTSRIGRGRVGNVTDYFGREQRSGFERIEACISDLGNNPEEFAAMAERLLSGTARTCDGQAFVLSFSESDFPPGVDYAKAVAGALYELMKRGGPDAPCIAIAQRDGKSGLWHGHGIRLNHNLVTGKADRGTWYHEHWRALNDELMRELGLSVCGREAELSSIERIAQARGIELATDAELVATAPGDVRRDQAESFIGAHVTTAPLDGRLAGLPADGEAVTVDLPGDPDHRLSVRARGTGLSYAIVGADGAPVMCAPGARGGKPRALASTGTKLDKALARGRDDATFTRPGMTAMLRAIHDELEEQDDRDRPREAEPVEAREGYPGAAPDAGDTGGSAALADGDDAPDRSRLPSAGGEGGDGAGAAEPAPERVGAGDPGEAQGRDDGARDRGREDRAQSVLASLAARLGVVSTVPATAAGALVASPTVAERLAQAAPEPVDGDETKDKEKD